MTAVFFVVEIMPYNVKRLKKYHDVNYVARKSAGLATILLLNKKSCKYLEHIEICLTLNNIYALSHQSERSKSVFGFLKHGVRIFYFLV